MVNPKVLEQVVEETRQVMKKRRVEKQKEVQPDEEFSSKAEHTVKKLMYPRTIWDIPSNALEKPNFAVLRVPEWVNGREEGEEGRSREPKDAKSHVSTH